MTHLSSVGTRDMEKLGAKKDLVMNLIPASWKPILPPHPPAPQATPTPRPTPKAGRHTPTKQTPRHFTPPPPNPTSLYITAPPRRRDYSARQHGPLPWAKSA